MSVGAGLGVALSSVLSSWGSHISMGQVPSLQLDKKGISIAYRGQRAQDSQDSLIPIKIDGHGNDSQIRALQPPDTDPLSV